MKPYLYFALVFILGLASCQSNPGIPTNTDVVTEPQRAALTEESIFQVTDSFTTQENQPFLLDKLKGRPTVIGMIFTNCTYACSRLTSDIKNIADSLQSETGNVNYVLISFDTERDKPAQLKKFADEMKLGKNWTLLHGSDEAVRTLSVLLNVQYEQSANGSFSHSNMVNILDKNGLFVFQQEGLNANHGNTIDTLKKLIKGKTINGI